MRALLLFITFILTVSAQCPFPGIPVHGRGVLRSVIAPPRQINEKDGGKEFKVGDIISYSCDRADLYNHCIHTTRVELENLHEIKCQQNGLWMGSLPNCMERIGGYDWRRIQYLTGKGRKPFTEFKRHYISTQFNFKFYDQRYVSVSHVSTVEVELYEDTIRDLNVAINAAGNAFYNCSLLCKWNNIQIFDCSHLSTTNKLVEDIEIKAVGETSLKQVNAAIQPAHYCGLPPIPIDGAVIPIKDSPCRYEYRCFNGAVLQGYPFADCNPATGEWDPIPTCKSENRIIDNNGKVFASEDLSTIDNKGKIFAESESSEDLSSVASSAPSSQKCNIFIITVVALLLLLNHL